MPSAPVVLNINISITPSAADAATIRDIDELIMHAVVAARRASTVSLEPPKRPSAK